MVEVSEKIYCNWEEIAKIESPWGDCGRYAFHLAGTESIKILQEAFPHCFQSEPWQGDLPKVIRNDIAQLER